MSAKDLWRSKTMVNCKLIANQDNLRHILENLIKIQMVQFQDENENVPLFQRLFSKDMTKIQEVEQKLTFLRQQVESSTIEVSHQQTDPNLASITNIENYLDTCTTEFKNLSQDLQTHEKTREAVYMKYLVTKYQKEVHVQAKSELDEFGVETPLDRTCSQMLVLVPRRSTMILQRTLYRVTYSNIFFESYALNEEIENSQMDLLAIYVTGTVPAERVKKVLNSYNLQVFDIQQNPEVALQEIEATLKNFDLTMNFNQVRINKLLYSVSAYINYLHEFILTEKAICHTMNMFSMQQNIATCHCWIPEEHMDLVEQRIRDADEIGQGANRSILEKNIETHVQPPTMFPTNKYTEVFQNIVQSYGTPSYKEINPAFFYLYQFPFTFSLMFGDVGHGVINAIVGLLMIIFEKKLSLITSDMFQLVFMGRYVIFLMSCYSIITGLIYNDFFALGFDIFGSKYHWKLDTVNHKFFGDYPAGTSPVYNFGMDSAWHWADNSMIFLNSYKMKLSVVVGIAQMIFGLFVKLINLVIKKDTANIICCWIPEFFFMASFFGYMVFCIIYKWLTEWKNPDQAPALINMLIQIFLSPNKIEPSNQLFNNINTQTLVQQIVFVIAVISALWLMLAEPIHEIVMMKKHPGEHQRAVSDIVVQQVIHTIEYVLGCISHTASYLRLWALSLAHSQLAEVFFDQIIGISMKLSFENKIMTYIVGGASLLITFGGWFGASIAVLCLMEALSAFLHCLRLAWIEFNSKFFIADGYPFEPLRVELGLGIEQSADMARDE
ncbi:V-type_proton ATPase subunit a [Hexamita inflata]|uniref:V-type proton ATPase subunit a n=1 Tax=Hexamita inflata TaxID=28002 RepID=A0AA86N4P8_9EUKA|nr:V-type proton ATPase subunit a [Hexamita inflata]